MPHVDGLPSNNHVPSRPPDILLTPFGWTAEPLAEMAAADPRLLADLIKISRPQMHLIALGLAHLDTPAPPEFCLFLTHRFSRKILNQVLAAAPAGIGRALHHMPVEVLDQESYRRLVNLLGDPESAKVLNHADEISDLAIQVLYALPKPLRRPLAVAVPGWPHKLDGFADGLRFLVSRGVASSFDALVADLAPVSRWGQLVAKIEDWVEGLPLPETLPAAVVGQARRLDRVAEVRSLGRAWRNCLGDYVSAINAGQYAVYLWEEPERRSPRSDSPGPWRRMGSLGANVSRHRNFSGEIDAETTLIHGCRFSSPM